MSKAALITGASNGIGFEMAKIFAVKDINLVLVARRKDKLDELKRELEAKHKVWVYTIGKDLALPGATKEIFDEVKANSLSIDYLVNNAGFGDFGPFAESDWNKQEQMINLNITTLAHFTRLFLPDMICRGGGKILNVASTASFQPGPMMSVYYATKAFVLSFSEAVNDEVRKNGITITALCPGPTKSGFQGAAAMEGSKLLERIDLATSKEVAEYGYKAMMKGRAVAIHGFKNSIMANSVRFAPRALVVKVTRKIQEKKL